MGKTQRYSSKQELNMGNKLDLKNIMLSGKSQPQQITYRIIPFI